MILDGPGPSTNKAPPYTVYPNRLTGSLESSCPNSAALTQTAPPVYSAPALSYVEPAHLSDEKWDCGYIDEKPPVVEEAVIRPALPAYFAQASWRADPISGNIISLDPKLSESPTALLDFLDHHAKSPPHLLVKIRSSSPKLDFTIDASDDIVKGLEGDRRALLYVANVDQASSKDKHRRRHVTDLELGSTGSCAGEGKAPRRTRATSRDVHARIERGEPGFVHPLSLTEMPSDSPHASRAHPPLLYKSTFVDLVDTFAPRNRPAEMSFVAYGEYDVVARQHLHHSDRVQAEIDAYCTSKNPFRVLSVQKELSGFNWSRLRSGLEQIIKSETSDLQGLDIKFECAPMLVTVRPLNFYSRILTAPLLIKILLSVFLIYPLVLLLETCCSTRYDRLRASFPLNRWLVVDTLASPPRTRRPSCDPADLTRLPCEETPLAVFMGTGEREWLAKWESAIEKAVNEGVRDGKVI